VLALNRGMNGRGESFQINSGCVRAPRFLSVVCGVVCSLVLGDRASALERPGSTPKLSDTCVLVCSGYINRQCIFDYMIIRDTT